MGILLFMDMTAVNAKLHAVVRDNDLSCPVCKGQNFETGKIYNESKLRYTGPTPKPEEPENVESVCRGCGYVFTFKIARLLEPVIA